jgi:hypothetical protein
VGHRRRQGQGDRRGSGGPRLVAAEDDPDARRDTPAKGHAMADILEDEDDAPTFSLTLSGDSSGLTVARRPPLP